MKALAIDCAVSRLTIAAKNEGKTCTCIYDIGMKQSEILVPSIEYVLSKVDLTSANLDYTVLTEGPGSFTGLRLGFSALKAIELAYNIPVYGISSLKAYEYSFAGLGLPIVTGIDANKDKFFARISDKYGNELLKDGDYEIEQIANELKDFNTIIAAGPDGFKLKKSLEENYPSQTNTLNIIIPGTSQCTTDALFTLAEKHITAGKPSLKDYDGPVYLRESEAETVLKKKLAENA